MPYHGERRTIPIDEARGILAVHGEPIRRTSRIPIERAAGRVLARTVIATRDIPPFSRAVMDGYAVVAGDTATASREHPSELTLVDSIFAGGAPRHAVRSGECAAIATGAPMPDGADAVVMVEHSSRSGERVAIYEPARARQHIGRAGGDIVAGETALTEGTVLTPARLAVAAALGLTELDLYDRPRVAVLSTGDEIVAPGRRLGPGQIFDSNTTALTAAVDAHGGEPVPQPRTRDDRDALTRAFQTAAREDIVLFCGGSSVGERDYSLDILASLGTVYFEGLQLKPGKPTIFATVNGVPVFGLPGNPVSCLTNLYLFVAPMLRRIARLPPPIQRVVAAHLAEPVTSPAGRHQIYPVRLDGLVAVPVFKSSGEITSLARADGFFEIPADVERVDAGARIDVILF
jgi:molybdenum cofactor synthesis domain-containing protein